MIRGIEGNNFQQNWLSDIFSRIDTNSDGEVSESEFKDLFSKLLEEKKPVPSFQEIDTDQSNSISKEELGQFLEEARKKMPPPPPPPPFTINLLENLEELFAAIDTNGDGVISETELAEYFGTKEPGAAESGNEAEGATETDTTI